MNCDVHPENSTTLYLEQSETGDCYYMCRPEELQALLDQGWPLVPCGHDGPNGKATWPQALGLGTMS